MIKCERAEGKTETRIKGEHIDIMTELAAIIKVVREGFAEKEGQEMADEDIRKCIRLAFMTEEEIDRETENRKKVLKDKGIDENTLEALKKAICG